MGEANLLPCPFCGYTGASVTRNTVAGDFVVCVGCGARGPNASTEEGAIAGWNRRRDLGEVVNAAWRKANLLGIELAEERVISEARERANVAARERIAELEERIAELEMESHALNVSTVMDVVSGEALLLKDALRLSRERDKREAEVDGVQVVVPEPTSTTKGPPV